MDGPLPLPTLLSHVLVAFTIEFDNEAERQMRHRTTRHGGSQGALHAPWLVSMAMWSNCMQFVGEEGVSVRELESRARTKTNMAGMERWGYIVVEPDPSDHRPKPPRSAWVVRATSAGRKAQDVWRPLFGVIEKRWQERFGNAEIEKLRESLLAVASQFAVELPDCLPILGYGLFSTVLDSKQRQPAQRDYGSDLRLPLAALLARVLLAFAIEFESEADLSLAICANALRVLGEKPVRVRDLPLLSGVSKEAIEVSLSFLSKRGYVVVATDKSASRTKVAWLTGKGRTARDEYRQRVSAIEKRWQTRFGKDAIRKLRQSLEPLVGDATPQLSPLFGGLEPYPDGWRASVRRPDTLPHFPMVLHRGGFPDGS